MVLACRPPSPASVSVQFIDGPTEAPRPVRTGADEVRGACPRGADFYPNFYRM
jgi:hypothetical protein